MLSLIEILFYIIIFLIIIFVIVNIKSLFRKTNIKKEHLNDFQYTTKGQMECENQLKGMSEIHYIGSNKDANKYFKADKLKLRHGSDGFRWLYCDQTGTKESCQDPYNFYKPSKTYYPTERDINIKSCKKCIQSDNKYYDRRETDPIKACKNINGKTSVEVHNNCISIKHGKNEACITNSCSYIKGGIGGITKPGKCVNNPNSNWWYVKTDNSEDNSWAPGKTCATSSNITNDIYVLQEPIQKNGDIKTFYTPYGVQYCGNICADHGQYNAKSIYEYCEDKDMSSTGGWWQSANSSAYQCRFPSTTITPEPVESQIITSKPTDSNKYGTGIRCIGGWSNAECEQKAAIAGIFNSSTLDYKENNMEACGKGVGAIFRNIDNKGNWNGRCWQQGNDTGLTQAQEICSKYNCSAISYECSLDKATQLCAYEPRFGLPTSVTEWNNHDNTCPKQYPYAYDKDGKYNSYCCNSTNITSSNNNDIYDICNGDNKDCDKPPCKNYVNFQKGYNVSNKSWMTDKLKSGTGYCAYRQ